MPTAKDPSPSGLPWWVTAASVLVIPVILTLITQFYTYQARRDEALRKIQTATTDATTRIEALKSEAEQKSRELDIHMVEIALSLVKPDPNVDPTKIGAREWAIDVMEKFSGIPFSAGARKFATTAAASTEEAFLKYLRAYGVRVEPGTCFNLLGQFPMTGFLFGKVTDASCP